MAQRGCNRSKTQGSSKRGRPVDALSPSGPKRRGKQGFNFGSSRKLTRPKHRNARYALTIIGRLIQRRIRNSALYEKGVSLVSHISSCSLLSGWSGHGQDKKLVGSKGAKDTSVHVQVEASKSCESQSTSDTTGVTLECNSSDNKNVPGCKDNDSISLITVGRDINRNATNKQPESRDTTKTQKPPSQRIDKKAMRVRRKVVSRQGLVARSIGRPRLKEPGRPNNKKFRLLHPNKKRSKRLKLLQKRLLKQKQDDEASTSSASLKCETSRTVEISDKKTLPSKKKENKPLKNVTKGNNGVANDDSTQAILISDTQNQKDESHESLEGKRSKKKKKRRNKRSTEALLSIFDAGPSNNGVGEGKEGRNKTRQKRSRQSQECDKSKSVSKSSVASAHLCLRNTSADNIHWPSLGEASRTKGLIKETAREIIKGKQGGSVTKMTRKRWADIVAMRSREENFIHDSVCKKIQTSGLTKNSVGARTWASVAANKQTLGATISANNGSETCSSSEDKKDEVCKPESSSMVSTCLKKKTRSGSRLACTDKLYLDGSKGKGKPQSSKFSRRHLRDGSGQAKKREVLKSRRKKCQQRRERDEPQPSPTTSQEVEVEVATKTETPTRERQKRAKSKSPRQEETQNDWCIDKMSVVYTQPVSTVISLNEPNSNILKQTGVNRCNNRTVTPSKTKSSLNRVTTRSASKDKTGTESEDDSGMELCARMSLISFQSSSHIREAKDQANPKQTRRENSTPRQKSSKHKRQGAASHSKETPRTSQEECEQPKQRKISLRYRALLRENGGRMDAKAVSEMNTRTKRTEVLQEDKEATRMKQRRQRQQRQQTNHDSQRSPATGPRLIPTNCVTDSSPAVTLDRPKRSGTSRSLASKPSCNSRPESSKNVVMLSTEPGTSPQAQEDVKLIWRPTDNSGANNSSSLWESGMPSRCPELKSPMSAKSAPELAKYEGRISVELLPVTADTLDMGWWHAYLNQIREPCTSVSGDLEDIPTTSTDFQENHDSKI